MEKKWYVYIMANKKNWTLYIWVTSDLQKRVSQHKNKLFEWFTAKYNIDKLVWFCELSTIQEAIEQEKRIKSGNRRKKIELIESINIDWSDLSEWDGLPRRWCSSQWQWDGLSEVMTNIFYYL